MPKECLYRSANRIFIPSLTFFAFHKEKPVPKWDARKLHWPGWPPLGALHDPTGQEVQRASSFVGTSAPDNEDIRQAIWVGGLLS
jgi:hypothetical protein